jgi:predicted enzyme related to lactoylglutathione lyase
MTKLGLVVKRVIIFARNVSATADFYRRVFGLTIKGNSTDSEFIELDAGTCSIGVHKGKPPTSKRGIPKIVFECENVEATRNELVKRGANFGRVRVFDDLHICDGEDPEGNVLQLSNRR